MEPTALPTATIELYGRCRALVRRAISVDLRQVRTATEAGEWADELRAILDASQALSIIPKWIWPRQAISLAVEFRRAHTQSQGRGMHETFVANNVLRKDDPIIKRHPWYDVEWFESGRQTPDREVTSPGATLGPPANGQANTPSLGKEIGEHLSHPPGIPVNQVSSSSSKLITGEANAEGEHKERQSHRPGEETEFKPRKIAPRPQAKNAGSRPTSTPALEQTTQPTGPSSAEEMLKPNDYTGTLPVPPTSATPTQPHPGNPKPKGDEGILAVVSPGSPAIATTTEANLMEIDVSIPELPPHHVDSEISSGVGPTSTVASGVTRGHPLPENDPGKMPAKPEEPTRTVVDKKPPRPKPRKAGRTADGGSNTSAPDNTKARPTACTPADNTGQPPTFARQRSSRPDDHPGNAVRQPTTASDTGEHSTNTPSAKTTISEIAVNLVNKQHGDPANSKAPPPPSEPTLEAPSIQSNAAPVRHSARIALAQEALRGPEENKSGVPAEPPTEREDEIHFSRDAQQRASGARSTKVLRLRAPNTVDGKPIEQGERYVELSDSDEQEMDRQAEMEQMSEGEPVSDEDGDDEYNEGGTSTTEKRGRGRPPGAAPIPTDGRGQCETPCNKCLSKGWPCYKGDHNACYACTNKATECTFSRGRWNGHIKRPRHNLKTPKRARSTTADVKGKQPIRGSLRRKTPPPQSTKLNDVPADNPRPISPKPQDASPPKKKARTDTTEPIKAPVAIKRLKLTVRPSSVPPVKATKTMPENEGVALQQLVQTLMGTVERQEHLIAKMAGTIEHQGQLIVALNEDYLRLKASVRDLEMLEGEDRKHDNKTFLEAFQDITKRIDSMAVGFAIPSTFNADQLPYLAGMAASAPSSQQDDGAFTGKGMVYSAYDAGSLGTTGDLSSLYPGGSQSDAN